MNCSTSIASQYFLLEAILGNIDSSLLLVQFKKYLLAVYYTLIWYILNILVSFKNVDINTDTAKMFDIKINYSNVEGNNTNN